MSKKLIIILIMLLILSSVSFAESKNIENQNIPVSTEFFMEGDSLQLAKILDWTDIVQLNAHLSVFTDTVIALKSDGTVVIAGELITQGGGDKTEVLQWKDIKKIDSKGQHILGLKSDGTVNISGASDVFPMKEVKKWKNIVDIASGYLFSAALESKGTVVVSGVIDNIDVSNWRNVAQIYATSWGLVGLRSDGTVLVTGSIKDELSEDCFNIRNIRVIGKKFIGIKYDGKIISIFKETEGFNEPDIINKFEVESHTVYIKSDGATIVTSNNSNNKIDDWENAKEICQGRDHIYGLTQSGKVITTNPFINGIREQNDIIRLIKIDSSNDEYAYLKSDGTVGVITNDSRLIDTVKDWEDIIDIQKIENTQTPRGLLEYGIVGLKKDGTVVTYTKNDYFKDLVSDWKGIIQIDTGRDFIVGLRKDGYVIGVGKESRILGIDDWRYIVQICSDFAHVIGLKADGTVVAIADLEYYKSLDAMRGYSRYVPININDWSNIKYISTCSTVTAGVKKDGTVIIDGSNHGVFNNLNVESWTDIVQVEVDYLRTIGLKKDGTVVATGMAPVNGKIPAQMQGWYDVVNWKNVKKIYVDEELTTGYRIKPQIIIDGEKLQLDVEPTIVNSRTLVPLRAIFEKLGLNVGWNSDTKTITGTKEGLYIEIVVNEKKATINNKEVELDVPACITNNRTLVPVRFIAESTGANVMWDDNIKTVIISTDNYK